MTKGGEKNGDVSVSQKTGVTSNDGIRLSSRIRTRSSRCSWSTDESPLKHVSAGSLSRDPSLEGIQTRHRRRQSSYCDDDFQYGYRTSRRHTIGGREKRNPVDGAAVHGSFNGGVVGRVADSESDCQSCEGRRNAESPEAGAVDPGHVLPRMRSRASGRIIHSGRTEQHVFVPAKGSAADVRDRRDVAGAGRPDDCRFMGVADDDDDDGAEHSCKVRVNGTASCEHDRGTPETPPPSGSKGGDDKEARLDSSEDDSEVETKPAPMPPSSKTSDEDSVPLSVLVSNAKNGAQKIAAKLPDVNNGATKALHKKSRIDARTTRLAKDTESKPPPATDTSAIKRESGSAVESECGATSSCGGSGSAEKAARLPVAEEPAGAERGIADPPAKDKAELALDDSSQGTLFSNDGDTRDSADMKAKHDSDSCGASITSGEGRPAGSRSRSKEARSRIDFHVGAKVEARDCMNMWYPSKIIQVDWDEKEVLIHFERWNSRFDEWVSMDSPRLRAPMRCSTRKDKTEHNFRVSKGFRVGEVILARWADCKMYPAKILKIFPDSSYNVVFYDGFERVVQSINVKKLPPEMVGRVNFKSVPPPPLPPPPSQSTVQQSSEKRKRVPSAKYTSEAPVKRQSSVDKGECKTTTAAAAAASSDKPNCKTLSAAATDQANSKLPSSKPKAKPSPPVPSNGNRGGGSGGVLAKKRKLVIGGIFQAKRHQLPEKGGGSLIRRKGDNRTLSSKPKVSRPNAKSATDDKQKKEITENNLSLSMPSTPSSAVLPPMDGDDTPNAVARKQFVIEEDHNHFKCPMEGCSKGFRKSSLLSSHIKHYHREANKRSSGVAAATNRKRSADVQPPPPATKPKQPLVPDHEESKLAESLPTQPKVEGDMDRKLITEKRRQLLLQKRLEMMYKKRQQQLALEKARLETLEKSKQAKRARLSESQSQQESSSEATTSAAAAAAEDTDTQEAKKKATRKSRTTKSGGDATTKRRRHTVSGEDGGQKSPPPSSKSKLQDASPFAQRSDARSGGGGALGGKGPLVFNSVDGKVFRSAARKRKFLSLDPDTTDSSSTTSSSSSVPSSDRNGEERHVLDKLTKEFKQFTRNRQAVRTCREWKESGREEVVNCRCQLQEEEGLMMQCEVCLAWQHGTCFDIEDERKVPENYVCFACEGARGMRQSFRYRHHQDWFKRGELASFRLLPKRENWKLMGDMLRTHDLVGQMLAINQVLYGLQCKFKVVKEKDRAALASWAKPHGQTHADSSGAGLASETKPNVAAAVVPEQRDGGGNSWSFCDHSYSAPNHAADDTDSRVPSGQTVVFDTCLEPEIEGIQITVSTSSPPPSEAGYPADASSVRPDPAELEVSSSPATVPDAAQEPQEAQCSSSSDHRLLEGCSSSALRPHVGQDSTKPVQQATTDVRQQQQTWTGTGMGAGKKAGKSGPRNNVKKKCVTKEFRLYECQLNLLNHIEQLQEEVDKRMDDICQHLETLESSYECSPATGSDDGLTDMPRVKRLLKGMATDLTKARRMSLYC